MDKTTISVMDWLIHKPITLILPIDTVLPHVGSHILYRGENDKEMVGIYIGYPVESSKTGEYLATITGDQLLKFDRYHQKSTELFKVFKHEFKQRFPQTKPVTARANRQWDTVYLYFYCEERLDFADFVRYFRTKMPIKFFLYQIGARDMVRLAPNAKEWLSECGCWPMWCCGSWPLPTVEMENIALQSLEWRDVEKLKGRCGKLKCSIVFEKSIYLNELSNFPFKWQEVLVNATTKWVCIGHNIMNQEIVVKSHEWEIIRTQLEHVRFDQWEQKTYYERLMAPNRYDDN